MDNGKDSCCWVVVFLHTENLGESFSRKNLTLVMQAEYGTDCFYNYTSDSAHLNPDYGGSSCWHGWIIGGSSVAKKVLKLMVELLLSLGQ